MDDLIHCSKCEAIPYDVLMMNCNHNLCIKCAVERMQAENTTKTVAGRLFLQCNKCKVKTNLDEESIVELEKAQKTKGYVQKIYFDKEGEKRIQTPINTARPKNLPKKQEKDMNKIQIKAQQFNKSNPHSKRSENDQIKQKAKALQNSSPVPAEKHKNEQQKDKKQQPEQKKEKHHILVTQPSYGQCEVHKQEPVMYYCFTCKIHCFCAECILIGKHNQHDVKVIKKAYAIVEKQLQQAIAVTKKVVAELIESNKVAANNINASKNKTDNIKKIIQKGFDEVRATIREKELQFMKMIDQKFMKMMETNHGLIKKNIEANLKQQQELVGKLEHTIKKGEKYSLNFYADEWPKLQNTFKKHQANVISQQNTLTQPLDTYISDLQKAIQKVEIHQLKK